MSATSATQHIALNVNGVKQLRLHVDDAGDGIDYDHADWAAARVTAAPPVIVLATPSNLSALVAGANQINLTWTDNGSNESGFLIERSTDGVNFTQIASVGPTQTNYPDNNVKAGQAYIYRVRATANGALSGYSNTDSAATPALPAQTYLSDLPWVSASAGWGTVQKDLSIKGTPITLRKVVYPKGIGTHAVSSIVYNLNGQYSSFVADVGVDDDTKGQGAVDFQVIGDGKILFDSGVLTGTSAVKHINVSIAGIKQLTLVANNGVAGSIDYDHADWAGAMVTTSPVVTTLKTAALVSNSKLPVSPTNLAAAALAPKQVKLTWTDNSKNETSFVIERKTANGRWIKIASAKANAMTFVDKTAKPGMTYAYRIRAHNRYGYSAYSNIVNIKTPLVKTLLQSPTTLF
jgi:hypothetical protein